MSDKLKEHALSTLALASVASLASVPAVDDSPLPQYRPARKPRGRCRDMKKKRKRRMVKESRRRNR